MISRNMAFVLGISLVAVGCTTTKRNFDTDPALLSATGSVKVSSRDDHNRKVVIDVKHLAKPEKVQPGAKIYVLWVQPYELIGAQPQNIGAFNVDNDLSGEFQSATTHSKFDIFVTAEPNGESSAPSGKRLLWSKVD